MCWLLARYCLVKPEIDTHYRDVHELVWIFHDTMSIERRTSYRDRFPFDEYFFCPLTRASDLKHLLGALQERYKRDGLRRLVVFDDLQVNLDQFNEWMTYFLWHAREFKILTISTVLAHYEWDELKGRCQEMAVFKLNNRRIIDRIVKGTDIDVNALYDLYDSYVVQGVHEHIPLDLRPKRYDVRLKQ